jgi:hypothetical protein
VRIRDDEVKVTAIRVFERGDTFQRSSVGAGQIAKLWGLGGVRIGDELGVPATERRWILRSADVGDGRGAPSSVPRRAPCMPPSRSSPSRTR